jgi:hypothetical protein
MRNLNSILLEGTLIDAPVLTAPSTADAPAKCTFSIVSEPDAPSVPVVVHGRLALYCAQHLFQSSSIRIVGRISQDIEATATTGTFHLCVIAEHIEIKPSSSRKLPTEEAANAF